MRTSKDRGYTLIELLISILLMMVLLLAMTQVFITTTDTVTIQEARTYVYTNARYAMDIMHRDLTGCASMKPLNLVAARPTNDPGLGSRGRGTGRGIEGSVELQFQAFSMDNGVLENPGQLPKYDVPGGHIDRAGDRITFRTTTGVGDTMQTVEVSYYLIPSNMAIDPSGALVDGDSTHEKTIRTGRGLFTLIRQIRASDPASNPPEYIQMAQVMDRVTGALVPVIDTELCHYVISFNLEYYADNQTFSQIDPGMNLFPRSDPLGDARGENDVETPYTVPAIRVTIVIVEDYAERQERMIQRVIWIPTM